MHPLPDGAETSIVGSHPRLLFATLMLGLLPQGLGLTIVGPLLPEMAQEFGARGAFVAQMMMASVGIGLMFGSLAGGWVLERIGARSVLLGASLAFGCAGSVGLFIREPLLFLASRLIVGFAASCAVTTCLWGIAAAYQGNRRARAFGISGALSGATGLLSTILAGYLDQLGGWRLAFVQFPLFGIAVFLLARTSISRARPPSPQASESNRSDLCQFLPFILLVVLLFAIISMGGAQLPFLLQDEGLRDPAIRSLVLAVPTVTATLCGMGYGPLRKVLDAPGTLALALSCLCAGLVTIGWGSTSGYAAIGSALMGACVGIIAPCLYQLVADRTAEHSRSHRLGLLNGAIFLGVFLNPIVFAPIVTFLGTQRAFLIAALVTAVLAAVIGRDLMLPTRELVKVDSRLSD